MERACRRWITRTLEGPGKDSEVWTHAFPIGERRTDIVVDFFVPGVAVERSGALLEFYTQLYSRLYDEDVWMMTVRQERLDEIVQRRVKFLSRRCELGPIDELRAHLPLIVEFGGQDFRVLEVEGELIAHSTVCPHMLGPLENGKLRDGVIIECPWHGYQFDLRSGSCVKGRRCTLAPAPRVEVDPATSIASLVAAGTVEP